MRCVHNGPQAEVWLCDLTRPPDAAGIATLSAAEQARAQRFVYERDRVRFVAAHVALRKLLASKLGQGPQSLVFETGRFGKPFLSQGDWHFNLSHSSDAALIALSRRGEVGVDIEWVRELRDAAGLVARHFGPAEQAAWHRLPPAERAWGFHQAWARKEAAVKALGWGLNLPLETVIVGSSPSPHLLDLCLPDEGGVVRLGISSLTLDPGWAAALAWIEVA